MPILIFSSCLTLSPDIFCTAWASRRFVLSGLLLLHLGEKNVLDLVKLKVGIRVERDELVLLVQFDLGTRALETS